MRTTAFLGFALALATSALAAAPQGMTNARVETPLGRGPGLSAAVKDEIASRSRAGLDRLVVPTQSEGSSCCWSVGRPRALSRAVGSRTRTGFTARRTATRPRLLEPSGRVRILLRVERRAAWGACGAFSEGCPLDAGGLPFVWLEDVRAGRERRPGSPRLVGRGPGRAAREAPRRRRDAAVALTPTRARTRARALRGAAGADRKRRPSGWARHAARAATGLKRLVRDDADARFREHAIFALTQSHEPGAIDAILHLATLPDPHVRGQALFWLAQTAARRAARRSGARSTTTPRSRSRRRPSSRSASSRRTRACRCWSASPGTHKSYEVRKQAMFWLGQSGDPRALAFFEDVLKNYPRGGAASHPSTPRTRRGRNSPRSPPPDCRRRRTPRRQRHGIIRAGDARSLPIDAHVEPRRGRAARRASGRARRAARARERRRACRRRWRRTGR